MHPDRNPKADQDKFKEITAAYHLLSNDEKRKQYDELREMNEKYGDPNASSGQYYNQRQYYDGNNQYSQDQSGGKNKQYYRYTYYANQDPEKAKKEFEEFLKRSKIFRERGGQFGKQFEG